MSVLDTLQEIKERLKEFYHIEIVEKSIAKISNDDETLPFAICVVEPSDPDTVLLSLTVEFEDATKIADFVITLIHIANVDIAEPFYINHSTGNTYWGQEAHYNFEINMHLDLDEFKPEEGNFH